MRCDGALAVAGTRGESALEPDESDGVLHVRGAHHDTRARSAGALDPALEHDTTPRALLGANAPQAGDCRAPIAAWLAQESQSRGPGSHRQPVYCANQSSGPPKPQHVTQGTASPEPQTPNPEA